jgi:hypothetical protein
MKANKKTLMAVKAFLENDACVDMDELIDDLVHDTKMLKSEKISDVPVSADECIIRWGEEKICSLDEFLEKYTEAYTKKMCNVLDSFVGEDIDCMIEE